MRVCIDALWFLKNYDTDKSRRLNLPKVRISCVIWGRKGFSVYSAAAKLSYENNCAFYEESMKLLSLLAYIIRFIIGSGGKLVSTAESRHLGFFKMAAVNISQVFQ